MLRSRTTAVIVAVFATVTLLLSAYLGTYYALLQGQQFALIDGMIGLSPVYRIDHNSARVLLQPAHRCDRLLRPNHWRWENSQFVSESPMAGDAKHIAPLPHR
jgi:hypothetical protein